MHKEKLVLVGNGMAGVRTVEELLKLVPDKYDITIIGAEPYGNYNRILLSPVLAGEKSIAEIMINDLDWYDENNIKLIKGHHVNNIDRKNRIVYTEDGSQCEYDRLILATGSNPFILPVPGFDLPGVISYRDMHDVETMIETAKSKKHAVVIGGGLLGLEAAYGLLKQGMEVTVVHLFATLMERQLDTAAAVMLRHSLEDRGIHFLLSHQTKAILGENSVTGIEFKDETTIKADLVVMAAGIKPNIELAKNIGLYCERGVVVNDTLQTYDPRVYAVGECAQHRGTTYGLVAPLFEQAKVCANHLAELGNSDYIGSVISTKLKVTGIDLFSAGNYLGNDETEEITYRDNAQGIYKKLVVKDNCIEGAVLYGDTTDGSLYYQMMRDKTNISNIRENLLFGQTQVSES